MVDGRRLRRLKFCERYFTDVLERLNLVAARQIILDIDTGRRRKREADLVTERKHAEAFF
jgi:hypothetical protein